MNYDIPQDVGQTRAYRQFKHIPTLPFAQTLRKMSGEEVIYHLKKHKGATMLCYQATNHPIGSSNVIGQLIIQVARDHLCRHIELSETKASFYCFQYQEKVLVEITHLRDIEKIPLGLAPSNGSSHTTDPTDPSDPSDTSEEVYIPDKSMWDVSKLHHNDDAYMLIMYAATTEFYVNGEWPEGWDPNNRMPDDTDYQKQMLNRIKVAKIKHGISPMPSYPQGWKPLDQDAYDALSDAQQARYDELEIVWKKMIGEYDGE